MKFRQGGAGPVLRASGALQSLGRPQPEPRPQQTGSEAILGGAPQEGRWKSLSDCQKSPVTPFCEQNTELWLET